MLILSRKRGEALVIGGAALTAPAHMGLPPTPPGDVGPTGGGEAGSAPCAVFAADPRRSAGGRGGAGSDRRRDRPGPLIGWRRP